MQLALRKKRDLDLRRRPLITRNSTRKLRSVLKRIVLRKSALSKRDLRRSNATLMRKLARTPKESASKLRKTRWQTLLKK